MNTTNEDPAQKIKEQAQVWSLQRDLADVEQQITEATDEKTTQELKDKAEAIKGRIEILMNDPDRKQAYADAVEEAVIAQDQVTEQILDRANPVPEPPKPTRQSNPTGNLFITVTAADGGGFVHHLSNHLAESNAIAAQCPGYVAQYVIDFETLVEASTAIAFLTDQAVSNDE